MSDEFTLKITGLEEARRKLYAYSQQLGDRVVVDALKLGLRVIQREAKGRVRAQHYRTGRLYRGIVVKKSKIHNGKRAETIGVYMTLRRGKGKKDPRDAFYGRFIEGGWTDRAGRHHAGSRFIEGAFTTRRVEAVNLAVSAIERGADLLARKTGL